jgi:hypothetical protein
MPLSKLSSNSFNTQANLTSLSIGTAANRALGGNANTTTIATENPGLVTIGKPYDGGATTIRFTSNPAGYGNDFYNGISCGSGGGFNIYGGGYQSPIDNNTYSSNGANTIMYFGGDFSNFQITHYTGTTTAAAAGTHIGGKSYVRFLTPFQVSEYGNIKTPACDYVQGSKTSWTTTAGSESGGLIPFQAFQCRAFIKFAGTTNAIVKAANFSSITDTGTGSWRANFTNNLFDSNYTVVASGQPNGYGGANLGNDGPNSVGDSNTTTYVALECRDNANNDNEPNALFIAVFR